jgi:hypothetical protein
MTARHQVDCVGRFVRDSGFALSALQPGAGRLRHLGVDEIVGNSAAHVAVADEEDVGVVGLQHCSHDVRVCV